MYRLLYTMVILLVITSCSDQKKSDPGISGSDPASEYSKQNNTIQDGKQNDSASDRVIYGRDTVFVPESSPIRNKLRFLSVQPKDIQVEFITTGVVKPLSGHLAHVTTPFDGRVLKSFVNLGERVNAGDPLFEVSSSEYLETIRTCIQANQQKELAEKNYLRKKELLESGVISRKEYDESKAEFDLALKECEKASATLRIFNFDPEEVDMAKPLIVRSPISGEIVNTNITVGQYLKTDDDPVVTVADLQKIWVVARVKEKDLSSINIKDRAEVVTEGFPDKPVKGLVNYIGNIMDEQTRSVEVYLECDNQEKILKPGMFITTRFYRLMSNAIVIPSSSILQDNLNNYVFLKSDNNKFIKKDLMAETNGHNDVIVKAGLSAGDVVVTEGAIYLR